MHYSSILTAFFYAFGGIGSLALIIAAFVALIKKADNNQTAIARAALITALQGRLDLYEIENKDLRDQLEQHKTAILSLQNAYDALVKRVSQADDIKALGAATEAHFTNLFLAIDSLKQQNRGSNGFSKS